MYQAQFRRINLFIILLVSRQRILQIIRRFNLFVHRPINQFYVQQHSLLRNHHGDRLGSHHFLPQSSLNVNQPLNRLNCRVRRQLCSHEGFRPANHRSNLVDARHDFQLGNQHFFLRSNQATSPLSNQMYSRADDRHYNHFLVRHFIQVFSQVINLRDYHRLDHRVNQ